MLFGCSRLFTFSKAAEDSVLFQQCSTSSTFYLQHFSSVNVSSWWNGVEVKIFSENNDSSAILKHISSGTSTSHGLNGYGLSMRTITLKSLLRCCRKCLCNMTEEFEHILQRVW